MLLSLSRGKGSRGGRGRAKVGELSLAFIALPIVADAQKTALKTAVALGSEVPRTSAQLTDASVAGTPATRGRCRRWGGFGRRQGVPN
jgi:hypothetical protein